MSRKFTAGKKAIGICDRCGFEYKLSKLKKLTINDHQVNTKVCPSCWEPDHPQNKLGKYRVEDAQALREPRPDSSLVESRDIQWGWSPVGLNNPLSLTGLTNSLQATGSVGTVTITTT